jgi:HEAT repeat protein
VAGLVDALDDSVFWMNDSASDGLKALGPEATPGVIGALSDPDPEVRTLAAEVLGSYGSGAQAAIPALEALLEDLNSSVRAAAEEALGEINGDDAPSG